MIVGFLYSLAVTVTWALLAIFLKYSTSFVDPFTICVIRFFMAATLTVILFSIFKQNYFSIFKQLDRYMILGGLFLGINYIGFMMGIKYTSATNAQLIIQTSAFFTFVLGVLFLKEKCSRLQALGLVSCIVGFYLFYLDQKPEQLEDTRQLIIGNTWLIISALCWAFYAILQKKTVIRKPELSSLQINLVLYLTAGLILTPFSSLTDFQIVFTSAEHITFFFVLGLTTLVVYFFISQALKHISSGQMSCIIPLSPFLTILFLKVLIYLDISPVPAESVQTLGYLGMGFVLLGIAMIYLVPSFFTNFLKSLKI